VKPAPHLVRIALAALEANPDECVFVGDSMTGVVAGHNATVQVIGYANRPAKVAQLAGARADGVTASLKDIAAALLDAGRVT
jgi:beta-phosphoglucomutase-like phosphatase (HAD superfamily)